MKPKYYPHITVFGALLLLAAPLLLLVPSATSLQMPAAVSGDIERERLVATERLVASHLSTKESLSSIATVALENPSAASVAKIPPDDASPGQAVAIAHRDEMFDAVSESLFSKPPTDTPPLAGTAPRLAMRAEHNGVSPGTSLPESARIEVSDVPAAVTDQQAVAEMTKIPEAVVSLPDLVSLPVPKPADEPSLIDAKPGKEAGTMAGVEAPTPAPSCFDATGHLSMAGIGDDRTARSDWSTVDSAADAPVAHTVVDVIMQQPLESRRVSKVENVIAVCQERGWPIALVKSDLPDDYWWVQQMVGIRGNAFAARVNFGNAESIPGSVYHMVFVFLDSPDEVRRFRIAKQFKQIPEGLRRSRQFTFVRR